MAFIQNLLLVLLVMLKWNSKQELRMPWLMVSKADVTKDEDIKMARIGGEEIIGDFEGCFCTVSSRIKIHMVERGYWRQVQCSCSVLSSEN